MANNDILVKSNLLSSQNGTTVQQGNNANSSVVTGSAAKGVQPQLPVSEGQASQEAQKKAQKSNLNDKVAQLNDYMQSLNRSLRFSIDQSTDDVVVKVIDSKTNQLIRQIPSQEMLDIQHAAEKYRGLIFEKKA